MIFHIGGAEFPGEFCRIVTEIAPLHHTDSRVMLIEIFSFFRQIDPFAKNIRLWRFLLNPGNKITQTDFSGLCFFKAMPVDFDKIHIGPEIFQPRGIPVRV